MLKYTSVKKTVPGNHPGRPWVHFPLLISTFGQFSTSHRREICFLSILSTSVQTASGEGEWGRAGASLLGLHHQPCPAQCGQWGRHQQSHCTRGGAWWFCCQDVMLHTGLQRLSWSLLIKHFWRRLGRRGSCDSPLQRLGISKGLKGAKSKSFAILSY